MPIGAVLACDGEVLAEAYWRGIGHGRLTHPEHVVLLAANASVQPGQRLPVHAVYDVRAVPGVYGDSDAQENSVGFR